MIVTVHQVLSLVETLMDATRHIYDEELLDASLDALRLIESETREGVLRAGLQLIVKVIFVSSSVCSFIC